MRTIDKILTPVDCKYGAPLGRSNIFPEEKFVVTTMNNRFPHLVFLGHDHTCKRVFDCAVPMIGDGAYDKGGAYFGIGPQLRVKYTKDLTFIQFYRLGDIL